MELELREHQMKVIDALRDGFKSGFKSQLLYAPTGFGKTEVAIYLMKATAQNLKRASIVLDRLVLVDQTSMRLSKYGLDHGVYQSGHWKYSPSCALQVCSAQTLESRSDFPAGDLVIIDECHIARKQTSEFIKKNQDVRIIGLTATPFTKGLGDLYQNVVCGSTNNWLVDNHWLTPLKVFIAKEIDMSGTKKVAGEWSQDIATKRGMQITGDIVQEWIKKTHEIFGRPRKTIIFCAGVAHGADLVEQFAQNGYNFVSISYKDDDVFKKQAIEDFAKPDTEIHGLIATDILTRGFDVSDVMIGVSARPFSKSFSSHVQQMGRVMRPYEGKEFALWLDHCIASGQRVLTHRGLVPIELILITDKIWDGHDFVSHKGVISRGKRPVIEYAGLTATADHLVYTRNEGWCAIGYCAEKQKAIVTTGIGGTAVRQCDDYFSGSRLAWIAPSTVHACSLRMRYLWLSFNNFFNKFTGRGNERLSPMQSAKASSRVVKRTDSRNASAMQEQEQCAVRKLWWQGNPVQVRFVDFLRSLDTKELGMLAAEQGYGVGSHGQQRELRAWKHSMGDKKGKHKQPSDIQMDSVDASIQDQIPRCSIRGYISKIINKCWPYVRGNCFTMGKAIPKTEREVWDILDCGPRNSFTCEGLLVHNSGNYLRFRNDWDELYEAGVSDLTSKEEKAKKELTEKEKKESKCPSCGHLWPSNSDTCPCCGFVRQRRSAIEAVAGELQELAASPRSTMEDKQVFYSELLCYARTRSYNPNWASHKYREKFGVWPKGLSDVAIAISAETASWIRHRNIAWAKSRRL